MTTIETQGIRIACVDPIETWRAETLWTKEPGTLRWLATLRDGDVFADVGANIGLYSIIAARQVGPTGRVYAFEPHPANVVSLHRNLALNGLADRVTVIAGALGAAPGWWPFHYRSLHAGSSGSQLGHAIGEDGRPFAPVAHELTYQTTLAALAAATPGLRPVTAVKIDVDGNEADVLLGLGDLTPRTIQVETRAATLAAITAWMTAHGYARTERHDTASGASQIAQGADPDGLAYNLVFDRGAA